MVYGLSLNKIKLQKINQWWKHSPVYLGFTDCFSYKLNVSHIILFGSHCNALPIQGKFTESKNFMKKFNISAT